MIVRLPLLLLLFLLGVGRVEPVSPDYRFRDGFIFVDGEVSNLPDRSRLSLQQTELIGNTYKLLPYLAARVETIDRDGNSIRWQQLGSTDAYTPPAGFCRRSR